MNEEVLISREEYEQYCNACKKLQAYKEKEEKIREYVDTWVIDEYSIAVSTGGNFCEYEPEAREKLLQILDGSDK